MKSVFNFWKSSPKFRFFARTAAVAAGGYIVNAIRSGNAWTWSNLITGAGTAAFTAVVGVLGLEPFIGVKAKVVVPADQTVQQ